MSEFTLMNRPRYLRVKLLRKEGLSFQAIGERMGFSRQRAWQIYRRTTSKERRIAK